ncbi:MAG: hypothetical protein ACU837_09035 [Gammaproteobacteria bacterium]
MPTLFTHPAVPLAVGLGIALFWPWTEYRYFAPVRVIEIAPLNAARFLSLRGLAVMTSE